MPKMGFIARYNVEKYILNPISLLFSNETSNFEKVAALNISEIDNIRINGIARTSGIGVRIEKIRIKQDAEYVVKSMML
jgi:hypothetical protein